MDEPSTNLSVNPSPMPGNGTETISDDPHDDSTTPVTPEVETVDVVGQSPLEQHDELGHCSHERAWEHRTPLSQFGHLYSDAAPGHHVILLQVPAQWTEERHVPHKNVALSLDSGEPVFEFSDAWFSGSTDGQWQVRARIERVDGIRSLVLEPVLDAPEFWRTELSPDHHPMYALVSDDASRVVVLACGADESVVTTFSGRTGRRELSLSLPVHCPLGLPGANNQFVMSHDGLHLAFSISHRSQIAVVDMRQSSHSIIDLNTEDESTDVADHNVRSFSDLAGMAIAPTGAHLVLIGRSGRVRLWDLASRHELASLGLSGLFHINQRSYMPSSEAPVAFSRSGKRIAFFNQDGDVEVVDVVSRETLTVLPGSDFGFENGTLDGMGNEGSEAFKLEFLEGDAGLLISYMGGVAVWRCESSMGREGRTDVRVHLDGPMVLTLGETAEFTATHLGHVSMHGHAFFVNGALTGPVSTIRRLSWTPRVAGDHLIEVEVRDGLNSGRAHLEVQVIEE